MSNIVHNVDDRFRAWIGPWEVEPLKVSELTADDVGRAVIYDDGFGNRQRGNLSSWRGDTVWARFSTGDTAAACRASDLRFGVRPVTIDELRGIK